MPPLGLGDIPRNERLTGTQRTNNGVASANPKIYIPRQSQFQTQGGGLSRLEREDLLESHHQNRGVGIGWAHGGGPLPAENYRPVGMTDIIFSGQILVPILSQ